MILADLHCHSYYSDGQHSPSFLIQRAAKNGVTHLAITDHDFLTWEAGHHQANWDIKLVPGVEISCQWEGGEIHVLGLFVNADCRQLSGLLSRQREARVERIRQMCDKLEVLGIQGLVGYVDSLPCQAWTRSHVAEFLVKNGHCKSWQKAFSRYLSRKGKAYVPIQWYSLEQAIGAIHQAEGVAVLAHPGRYSLSKTRLKGLVEAFAEKGGDGLEGSYGNIDSKTRKMLCQLAIDYGLTISTGSDFHDASRHWTDIGKIPALDSTAKKNAIWNHPRWHLYYS